MTSQEKQILKEMGLKFKFVGSEVIIQGKISLTDYNRIMNTKPGTKTPKNPPKPPVWAQTLIANQAADHALLVQVIATQTAQGQQISTIQSVQTIQGNQINTIQATQTTQGNQLTTMQQDIAEMKNTPTMSKELGKAKP